MTQIQDLIQKINKALAGFKDKCERKYGVAIFDVKINNSNSSQLTLKGKVLTRKQKNELLKIVSQFINPTTCLAPGNIRLKDEVKIIGDPASGLEEGWGKIKKKVVDLKVRFIEELSKIEKLDQTFTKFYRQTDTYFNERLRASQAKRGEIVRIIYQKGNQLLVQLKDLTMGWVGKDDVVKISDKKNNWEKSLHFEQDKVFKVKIKPTKLQKKIREYIDAPYLWGGVTKEGFDCSGFVQAVYEDVFDFILPKHSWQQVRFGKEASISQIKIGDLVFLRHRQNNTPHIGIVYDKNKNILIAHSSRNNKGVKIETMEDILKIYNLVKIKRIVESN